MLVTSFFYCNNNGFFTVTTLECIKDRDKEVLEQAIAHTWSLDDTVGKSSMKRMR